MRFFIISLFTLLSINSFAQINGNGNIETITVDVAGIKDIDIQFNANITLDYSQEEVMKITADENVMEFIGRKFKNGKLTLDQIKWISPSKWPTITIGTPSLSKVYQGTHSTTTLVNTKAEDLILEGNVGKIIASGTVSNLKVRTEGTFIDLSNMTISNAYVELQDDGTRVMLDKVDNLETKLDSEVELILLSEPKNHTGDKKIHSNSKKAFDYVDESIKWIKFKIKNNSWKRNHFVVVGPKKDGTTFSYGFPMMPGTTREENWTVGTKIYKDGKLWSNQLLVTISDEDAGKTVKLFE